MTSDSSNPPHCPLCGADRSDYRFSERGFEVRVCSGCELVFIAPYPSDVDAVHDAVTDNHYDELQVIAADRQRNSEENFYRTHLPIIARESAGARSILDVGCGTGYLLEQLGRQRPDMFRAGIELNAARASLARKYAMCDVHQVPVEKFDSDVKFDVITMMNVLSHIPSFDRLFGAFRNLLSENGKLIIKTGEVARDARKTDLHDWGVPGHMHFLGMNTMPVICSKYGFRILGEPDRVPMSEELFSVDTLRTTGRSGARNFVKKSLLVVPGARKAVQAAYDAVKGRRIYSSLYVLRPEA